MTAVQARIGKQPIWLLNGVGRAFGSKQDAQAYARGDVNVWSLWDPSSESKEAFDRRMKREVISC